MPDKRIRSCNKRMAAQEENAVLTAIGRDVLDLYVTDVYEPDVCGSVGRVSRLKADMSKQVMHMHPSIACTPITRIG
jgi:hypothetical protein